MGLTSYFLTESMFHFVSKPDILKYTFLHKGCYTFTIGNSRLISTEAFLVAHVNFNDVNNKNRAKIKK